MELIDGSVDVPGAGKVRKKYLIIPAGLALAYVTWRWYQTRQDAASAPQTSDGTYTTPDLTDMGLATTGGSGTVTGNTGSTVTDGTNPNAIDSNAEWTQKAVELLTNQGYDGQTVTAALGEFLGHRALDKNEAAIARAALAVVGQPPVGGPWSVIEEAGTGTGTLAAPTNLRALDGPGVTSIGMQWDPVPGALHYRIFRTDTNGPGGEEPIGDSFDTKFVARGLDPNHTYQFYVRAVSTTNKVGGKSSVWSQKTKPVTLKAPTGLKASAITRTSFRVTCSPVSGATYYHWYINGQQTGASDKPYRDFTGHKPNTSYRISVRADTTNQSPGPMSATLTVKTKK